MTRAYSSQNNSTVTAQTVKIQSPEDRANQILNALIQQTSQQDYDEITVDKLINEYERLMA